MTLHVVHWIWSLGLGGDAKNLCMLASEQTKWARVSVLTELQDPGPRADELSAKNIAVVSAIDSPESLARFVNANPGPKIAIIHRNGKTNARETALIQAFCRFAIPCFEYNTFSRCDPTTDQYFVGHAHLSRSALLDYATRKKASVFDLINHAAIGYALELPPLIDEMEAKLARKNLGIAADEFVVLKIQRPDLRKWSPLPALAVSRLQNGRPPIRLLVQSAPSARDEWLKERLHDAVTMVAPTADSLTLRQTFAVGNCLANYSNIGETFGLGLAEAMSYGLPVIVNSTPRLDNAQIELCQHEKTGLVANTVSALSSALTRLMEDKDFSQKLGLSARQFIGSTFKADIVESRLRRFMIACLRGKYDSLAALIETPPEADDDYCLDQSWLKQYMQAQTVAQTGTRQLLQSLVDDAYINYLRGLDAFDYAAEIGPHALLEAIKRRAKHGFVLRG
jgi:hypothetical protein